MTRTGLRLSQPMKSGPKNLVNWFSHVPVTAVLISRIRYHRLADPFTLRGPKSRDWILKYADEALEAMKMFQVPFSEPILICKRCTFVFDGHHRILALKALSMNWWIAAREVIREDRKCHCKKD